MALTIQRIHDTLLAAYGPQGWWPLLGVKGCNPTASGTLHGYHPGDYGFPRDEAQRFEIAVGAILTQNTAWPNVERALANLSAATALLPPALLALSDADLETAIRPSGYFRAKRRKLRELAAFWTRLDGRTPTRAELLAVWGIGPETADSIRLYAYGQPEMVVDAYTRRILAALGLVPATASDATIRSRCEAELRREVVVYQEFHALMVEHAKRCYRRQPWADPLLAIGAEPRE